MWIPAAYFPNKNDLKRGFLLPVRVKEESEELLVQDASTGDVLHRWPFVELSLEGSRPLVEDEASGKITVYRDEKGPRVEINDLTALQGSGWAWRLPNQPPKKKTLGYGPPVSATIVGIGLAIVMIQIFSNPTASFERRLYDPVRVFSPSQVCTNPEGLAALDTLSKKVIPASSELPVRVEVIRGDEANLFAFPGGRVFVYDGLLQKVESPDEFADLLAHFAAHASLRHPLKALSQGSTLPVLLKIYLGTSSDSRALEPATVHYLMRAPFDSAQESAALSLTDQTLAHAKINQNSFIAFVQRLKLKGIFPNLFTAHGGLNETRETKEAAETLPSLTASEWASLKKICASPL